MGIARSKIKEVPVITLAKRIKRFPEIVTSETIIFARFLNCKVEDRTKFILTQDMDYKTRFHIADYLKAIIDSHDIINNKYNDIKSKLTDNHIYNIHPQNNTHFQQIQEQQHKELSDVINEYSNDDNINIAKMHLILLEN